MSQTEYFAPKSLKEATRLLSKYGEKSRVVAGGTDLIVRAKNLIEQPAFLINIANIRDLNYIKYDEVNGLRIGALTPIALIKKSALVRSKFAVITQAAGMLGTPAIRNQATIGGNLCNAAPSADTAPALVVLGARVKIVGVDGEKIVTVEDFFTGPGKTVIEHGQILTEIRIPNLPPKSGASYVKHRRTKGADLAVVGVAALVTLEGNILRDVKIALGAVAPTPIRAKEAEKVMMFNKLDDKLLEKAGLSAASESKPIDDTRSSADYRRKIVTVLVKRAVRQAVEQV